MIGDRHPFRFEADELVRECRSAQVSNSSLPTPKPHFPAGLPCSGDPCIPGPAPRPLPIPVAFFRLIRPLVFRYLVPLSIEAARRRGPLPIFPPSGFSIHHELLPVPSFCTRMNRVCRDRLWRIEFCRDKQGYGGGRKTKVGC